MVFVFATILIWTSIILTSITLIIALYKKSWKTMLLSGLLSLPFCLYMLGGEGAIFWFGFYPVIPLILTIIFFNHTKNSRSL